MTDLPVEYKINVCESGMTIDECQYNFNMAHCNYGYYEGWMDIFYCINPAFWAFLGLSFVLAFSIAGAAWGIWTTGVSIVGSAIKMKRIVSKNLISVIFCEAVAIYGVIVAIILQNKLGPLVSNVTGSGVTFQNAEYSAYNVFAIGFVVGASNLVCGLSVGVIGTGTALAHAQTPSTFVSMLIVQIFASALGLFGVIIGIIMANKMNWPVGN